MPREKPALMWPFQQQVYKYTKGTVARHMLSRPPDITTESQASQDSQASQVSQSVNLQQAKSCQENQATIDYGKKKRSGVI